MKVSELNENLEGDALYANLIKQQFPLGAGYDLNSGMTHEMWYRELKLALRWLATVVRAGEIDPPVSIGNDFTIRDQNGQNIGIPGQWNPSMKPKSAKPLAEDGRIVKGVNTTVDVGTNEIPRQARKFGFTVDKDGRPPTLSRKVKGKSTNVLYNLGLAESVQSIKFRMPNFDAEWSEAERYSEFKKIGKDKWIELAKKGKPVDIDNAMSNNINNTEAGEKDRAEFDNLDPNKKERFVKDLAGNNIELPIIAKYSDGYLELVGGNTRLTGMMSQLGQGKAWMFDVPDDVANLAEQQQVNEAIQLWPIIAGVFTLLARKKGVKKAKDLMTEFLRRMPPGVSPEVVLDFLRYLVGGSAGGYIATQISKNRKKEKEQVKENINAQSEIYVDMDGVLADFFGDWKKLVGKDWRNIKDIKPALQKIRDTEDFWLNLPVTSNAKNLLSLIKDIKGSYNILSSPLPDDPNSEPHKRQWIEKHLSFFPPKNVIITFDKAKYASQPDGTPNILIDDYGINIGKWEAAGGMGFKHKDHKFERTARNLKTLMKEDMSKSDIKSAHKKADKLKSKPKAKKNIAKWAKEKGMDPEGAIYAIAMNQQKKENISEGLDNPYPVKWEYLKREGGSRAKIELPDGTVLDINITEADYGYYDIEFSRGGTLKPTGDGDEFRVFATVVAAVTEWWNQLDKNNVMQVYFSADKADGRRSQLYKRFAQMFSKKTGWDYDYDDGGNTVAFGLTNPQYESYTRDQLPQIKNKNLQNIRHTIEKVQVKNLIPVQEERIMKNFKRQVDRLTVGKYNHIVVDCDNKIVNGHHRLDALKMLNIKEVEVARLPWKIKAIVENFADGKKKGKSRPGRVKRSGASCKGSVTSLRKKAKNASGENAKMYHWCANMKSGRK